MNTRLLNVNVFNKMDFSEYNAGYARHKSLKLTQTKTNSSTVSFYHTPT